MTATSVCITAILAFLLGRCTYISSRRASRLKKKDDEIKVYKNRLDIIENSKSSDRYYEIEEDDNTHQYNVFLKVYVSSYTCTGEHIESICWCLIKSFPFDNDKDFAYSEAKDLLDKLKEQ